MRADLILAAIFGAVFSATLVEVSGYRWEVALAPGLAAGLGLFLILVQVVKTLKAGDTSRIGIRQAEVLQFCWLMVAIGAVIAAGFGIGGGVYVFLHIYVMRRGRHRFATALICGLAVPAIVFGVFDSLLQIRLFPGLVLG